jgi:hypothetical protein
MKKYFLHDGTESSGPFDLEELKVRKITKTTPVWFEGMQHWKNAEEIPELSSVFTVIPPPFKSFSAVPPKPKTEKKKRDQKILGLSKNTFFVVLGLLVLAVGTITFNTLQDERSRELKLKNHKTEVENYQYELQQKEIEEQKIIVAEQQKKEAERVILERKQTISDRLLEIPDLIAVAQGNLEAAESKLNDSHTFKFLRTPSERNEQISLLQNEITSYKSEIEQLQKELEELKLESEKIK